MSGQESAASAEVEALAAELHHGMCYSTCWTPTDADRATARTVLASDWLAAYVQAARDEEWARALSGAADALEGALGIPWSPRNLYEFRIWLRERAARGGAR